MPTPEPDPQHIRNMVVRHDVELNYIKERVDEVAAKVDRLHWWLITTTVGVLTTVAMLLFDLVLRRGAR